MAGVNSRFAQVSEAEILQIQNEAGPENTKKVTKYGLKVLKVREDSKVLKSVKKCFGLYFADNCQ